MADILTHHLFGQKVFTAEEAVPFLARREDTGVFLFGLQGPDLFYYRKGITGQPFQSLGSRLHDEPPGQFFYCAARHVLSLSGRAREITAAYLGGLLCHYALDRAIHPYVAHFQDALKPLWPERSGGAIHCQIETDIDIDLYALWRKAPVSRFRPWDTMTLDAVQRDVLDRMWVSLVSDTCHLTLPAGEGIKALDDMVTFARLLYNGGDIVHLAARGAELFSRGDRSLSSRVKADRPRWDSLNLGGAPWEDAQGKERRHTVPDTLDKAEKDARKLLREYSGMLEGGTAKYKIFEENYRGKTVEGAE